jgi:hypothetical protein
MTRVIKKFNGDVITKNFTFQIRPLLAEVKEM